MVQCVCGDKEKELLRVGFGNKKCVVSLKRKRRKIKKGGREEGRKGKEGK